jgi:hypothetical protein
MTPPDERRHSGQTINRRQAITFVPITSNPIRLRATIGANVQNVFAYSLHWIDILTAAHLQQHAFTLTSALIGSSGWPTGRPARQIGLSTKCAPHLFGFNCKF